MNNKEKVVKIALQELVNLMQVASYSIKKLRNSLDDLFYFQNRAIDDFSHKDQISKKEEQIKMAYNRVCQSFDDFIDDVKGLACMLEEDVVDWDIDDD